MPEFIQENYDEGESGDIRHTLNPKLVFGSILFFGIFTLVYGGVKIWRDIRSPSLAQERTRQLIETAAHLGIPPTPTEAELRAKDTDGDSISDWDELNRYGTSPYLKDSDGDGYLDKQEIDTQNDPNCPRGQDCRIGAPSPGQIVSPSGLFSDLQPTEPPPEALGTPPPDLANMTPQQLRDLLLKSGQVSGEQLDQVDDATLMQMYQETLSQQAAQQPQ